MNKQAIFFAVIYAVITQSNGSKAKVFYQGMPQATVDSLLREQQVLNPGITYSIVSQKAFDAVPDPVRVTPPDPIKQQAVLDAKDTNKTPQERIDALVKAIDLR